MLAPGKEYLVEARLIPVARAVGRAERRRVPGRPAAPARPGEPAQDHRRADHQRDVLVPRPGAVRRAHRRGAARADQVAGGDPQDPGLVGGQLQRAGGVQPGDHCCRRTLPPGWTYEIMGTDISTEMVKRAEAARVQPGRGQPRAAGQPAGAVLRAGRRALADHRGAAPQRLVPADEPDRAAAGDAAVRRDLPAQRPDLFRRRGQADRAAERGQAAAPGRPGSSSARPRRRSGSTTTTSGWPPAAPPLTESAAAVPAGAARRG